MRTTSTTMPVKLKKPPSKLLTEEVKHVGRGSRRHASPVMQETQGMFAREQVGSQTTLTREYISTQDMFTNDTCKHLK